MKPLKDLGWKHGKMGNKKINSVHVKSYVNHINEIKYIVFLFKFQCQTMMPFVWFVALIQDHTHN